MASTADGHPTEPGLLDPGKEARSRIGIPVVPAFDGFRAFAILGVVLLHVLHLSGVVEAGDSGLLARMVWGTIGHAIDVLFIVSGFVVFLPTVARNGSFGSVSGFAIRRAARLLPAYWMMLAIILLLILLTSVSPDVANPSLRDVGLNFFGLQGPVGMFVPGISTGFGVDPPLWTLSTEIGFYVVLPFIAARYFRHPLAGLVVAGLITIAWNLAFKNIGDVSSILGFDVSGAERFRLLFASTIQLPSWAFSFGLGMTGAWAYVRWNSKRVPGYLFAIALTGFLVMAWLAGGYSDSAGFDLVAEYSRFSPEIAIGYSGFLAALMILIAMGPRRLQLPFANEPVRKLGDISYGVYLSHMVIAFYAAALFDLPDDGSIGSLATWLAVVVPAAVLYGYLSARFLEQPIRRWARRFGNRREA